MTTNKVWSVRDGQGYFGFDSIVAEANAVVGSVRTLKRWNQDSSWHKASYEAWLAWYSPLSSSALVARETETATVFVPTWN